MSTTTEQKSGVDLIAEERRRQVEEEKWTPEHDDEHTDKALAYAAACYALGNRTVQNIGGAYALDLWPWSEDEWKPTPKDRIRELVKAGALIAAEIDRLQRANPAPTTELPWVCPEHPDAQIRHTWTRTRREVIWGPYRPRHSIGENDHDHRFACATCGRELAADPEEVGDGR